jgi:hypothetical protein
MEEKKKDFGGSQPAPMPEPEREDQIKNTAPAVGMPKEQEEKLPSLNEIPVEGNAPRTPEVSKAQPSNTAASQNTTPNTTKEPVYEKASSEQAQPTERQESAEAQRPGVVTQQTQSTDQAERTNTQKTVPGASSTSNASNERPTEQDPKQKKERPGQGAIPAAPAQDISIRTMESDMTAIKEGGGVPKEPERFNPSDLHTEKKTFDPETKEAVQADAPAAPDTKVDTEVPQEAKSDGSKKKVLLVIGAFTILCIAIGYFFVAPLIFTGEPTGEEIASENETPGENTVSETPSFIHESFFAGGMDMAGTASVSAVSLGEVQASVDALIASSGDAKDVFQEVTFRNNADPMSSHDLLSVMLPSVDRAIVESLFAEDFSAFIYYDEKGAWPGYVFALSEEALLSSAVQPRVVVREIMESASTDDIAHFFTASPGEPQAAFNNGSTFEDSRYRTYSLPGASFNYGWDGYYLVLSTSYSGFTGIEPYIMDLGVTTEAGEASE